MCVWGSGGCEPRIEDIIKLKKVEVGVVWGPVGGQVVIGVGMGFDECEPRIESIVKRE